MALLILRKTCGYQKDKDKISLSQMMGELGLSKTRSSQIINRLQLRKIVTVTEYCNGIGKTYCFNKNLEEWVTVTEKCNSYRKVKQRVTLLSNRPLQKSVSTKENIQKKVKKDVFVVPSWMPQDLWNAYLELRRQKKAPTTPHALNLCLRSIGKLHESGNDRVAVVEQSVQRGWTGFFELKEESSGRPVFREREDRNKGYFGTPREWKPGTDTPAHRPAAPPKPLREIFGGKTPSEILSRGSTIQDSAAAMCANSTYTGEGDGTDLR